MQLDPWGRTNISDYSKLFDEFGISRFDEILDSIQNPHPYMRRGIIFGHRGYESIIDAINTNKPFSVMSGFMPSGMVHLGGKMVMDEIIWHQQQNADTFVGIADMEAHAVRGMSWDLCRDIGINEYIVSLIALGFEPGGHIYFQSDSTTVQKLAFELGIKANLSEMSAIYGFSGETNVSHLQSAVTQSADIMQPQLGEFGGPKPTVIPVGADQDPHIRLTRGLANKMNMFLVEQRDGHVSVRTKTAPPDVLKMVAKKTGGKLYKEHVDIKDGDIEHIRSVVSDIELKSGGYAFLPPASTYHRFMSGLTGGKMSSSIPGSLIALTEKPKDAAKKIMRGKTGGRETLEEQLLLGGEPEKCTIYELMLFHLVEDDKHLAQIHSECIEGERTCGTCKKEAAELMQIFLTEHQEKRELAKERLDEYGLCEYVKYLK